MILSHSSLSLSLSLSHTHTRTHAHTHTRERERRVKLMGTKMIVTLATPEVLCFAFRSINKTTWSIIREWEGSWSLMCKSLIFFFFYCKLHESTNKKKRKRKTSWWFLTWHYNSPNNVQNIVFFFSIPSNVLNYQFDSKLFCSTSIFFNIACVWSSGVITVSLNFKFIFSLNYFFMF